MSAGRADPREDELLRSIALGRDRTWILAHPEVSLTRRQTACLRQLRRRRASGVPIAYLRGDQDFYGRPFAVGRGVLVPRPETEHLVDAALAVLPTGSSALVADIGTGSGCIAITLALARPRLNIVATDQSATALRYARRNARRHRVGRQCRFFRGHFVAPILHRGLEPELIVANLPYATPQEYIPVRSEPRAAIVGGRDGLATYRRFFRQVAATGWSAPMILEVDPRRWRRVRSVAAIEFPGMRWSISNDLAGRPRILTVRPRRNAQHSRA